MSALNEWLEERLRPIAVSESSLGKYRRIPDSLRSQLSAQWYTVPIASGTSEAVLISPKNQATQRKAMAVLLHGLGDDCVFPHWHWISGLCERGIPVLALTWDGHSRFGSSTLDISTCTRTIPLLIQKLYGDGANPDQLSARVGPKCYLVGNSLGASLVLLAATRVDVASVVGGVVAISPMVTLQIRQGRASESLERYRPSLFLRDIFPRFSLYGFGALDGSREAFRRARSGVRLRVGVEPLEQVKAFVQEIFEDRQVLREVRVPVLWMHGARDAVSPLEKVTALMDSISAAKFVHIDERRGHRTMAMSGEIPDYAARFVERCLDLDEETIRV